MSRESTKQQALGKHFTWVEPSTCYSEDDFYNEKLSFANDSSRENSAVGVGDARGACEKEINQYEDADQQSITATLFDNNETEGGGIDRAQETHKSAGNASGNHELVTIARNGTNRSSDKGKTIISKQPHPSLHR